MGSEEMLTEDGHDLDYSRKVGQRLRAIRRQKRLSLQEAEELSLTRAS